MSIKHAIRERLRRARRELQSLRGRDLRLRTDVRLPTLHLGTDYGGWTVSLEHTRPRCTVVSVGVGTDISFDVAMVERFGATVHAFDPTPKSVNWMARQELPARLKFYPLGLAHFDGEQVFRLARADHTSYSSELEAGKQAVDEVRCSVRRLTTLAAEAGFGPIDILKIDIEGGEHSAVPDVLASGTSAGQLLLELHYDASAEQMKRALALVEQVRQAGYKLFARSAVGRELSFIHGSRL